MQMSEQPVQVKVKKLREGAVLPSYGSPFAAGCDLYACLAEEVVIGPGKTEKIPIGWAMELPLGYAGLIYARSGLATKSGLAPANKVGVVDCDYRGEICVVLYNHSQDPATVRGGDRVAQMVITPYLTVDFCQSEELSDTVRGEGGFGSTGK